MKILIIDYRYPNNPFTLTGHDCVVCDLQNALISLIEHQPDVIIAFVEYCAEEENNNLLEDVKRSMLNKTNFIRCGFLEERESEGETYLRLPYSTEEFQEALGTL